MGNVDCICSWKAKRNDELLSWEIYFWSCYELWERWWWWPSQPSEDPQWKMQCQVIKQTWEKLNPPRIRSYSSGCNCAEREKIEVLILNYLYELCMFVSVCHYVCVCLPVYAWVGDHQAKTISLGREKRIQSHGWERKSRWCDLPNTQWLQIFHQSIHLILFPEGLSFCGSTGD